MIDEIRKQVKSLFVLAAYAHDEEGGKLSGAKADAYKNVLAILDETHTRLSDDEVDDFLDWLIDIGITNKNTNR